MVSRAVRLSQTVITMLPSSPQVRTVYSESAGIIPTLQWLEKNYAQATLCIDSTTLDVDVARDIASGVISTGAQMIDAPVSGGAYTRPYLRPIRVILVSRGSRSGCRYIDLFGWRNYTSIQQLATVLATDGQTDYPLWSLRAWSHRENMQQYGVGSGADRCGGGHVAWSDARFRS